MNHVGSIFFAAALLTFVVSGASHGQGASAGPGIVLEQVEITLTENGREVERVRTSKAEKDAVVSEARKRGRLIKVRELDQPKLKFMDDNGVVIKEIQLGRHAEKAQIDSPLHGAIPAEREADRWATVSRNKKYAAVSENVQVKGPATEGQMRYGRAIFSQRGILNYYDSKGDVLWTKQTPENMGIGHPIVSDNGDTVAYIQGYIMGGLVADEPYEKLLVFSESGEEIFSFPKKREQAYRLHSHPVMSGNGRYLMLSVRKTRKEIVLFLDLKKKSSWETTERNAASRISDDGIAWLIDPDIKEPELRELNLKEYLGD